MPKSRLINAEFEPTFAAVNDHYANFIEIQLDSDFYPIERHVNFFHGLKLVSSQYQQVRKKVQKHTDFKKLAKWLTENQKWILSPPVLFLRAEQATEFTKLTFGSVKESDINHIFRFDEYEEEIQGPGWTGDIKIHIPYQTKRYPDKQLKFVLASYGIYITELAYGTDDEGRFLDCEFMMLERDFKINFDENTWRVSESKSDDDDEDDFNLRIWEIEEGLVDDEDPRI